MNVVAVIPTYHSARWIEGCIGSLLGQTLRPETIVVVDNGSDDDTLAIVERLWPDVHRVALNRNVGYGASVNVGAARADGDVLACNPDVLLDRACLAELSRALREASRIALAGPRLTAGDGTLQPSLYRFPTLRRLLSEALFLDRLPVIGGRLAYQRRDDPHVVATDTDWLPGAVLLVKRTAWDQIGGFDEDYFFFVEEVDLQARLRDAGWRCRFVPSAMAEHFGGKQPIAAELFLHSHIGLERFFRRRSGRRSGWAARAILMLTAMTRVIAWSVVVLTRKRSRQSAKWRTMFAGVLRLSAIDGVRRLRTACARARRGTSRGAG